MTQSVAISRFIARQHSYYPLEPINALECDWLVETFQDVYLAVQKIFFMKDQAKADQIDKVFSEILPNFLEQITPYLRKGQFLLGSRISLADFWIGLLYVNFF